MDQKFASLFNLTDDDDRHYYNTIPMYDYKPAQLYLKKWLELIQKHHFKNLLELNNFEKSIVDFEIPDIVLWHAIKRTKMQTCMDLQWANLTTAKSCFVALMMLDNPCEDLPRLKESFWKLYPQLKKN